MLLNFPHPRKGETFRSVLTRHMARRDKSGRVECRRLGISELSLASDIPGNIDGLLNALAPGHPWFNNRAKIITDHTNAPWHSYFLNTEERRRVLQELIVGASKNHFATLGSTTHVRLPGMGSRVCRDCLAEELEQGAGTFHRAHQIQCVATCARHGRVLEFASHALLIAGSRASWLTAGADLDTVQYSCVVDVEDERVLTALDWVSQQCVRLLDDDKRDDMIVDPRAALSSALVEQFKTSVSGVRMDRVGIANAIRARYPDEMLALYGLRAFGFDGKPALWPFNALKQFKTFADPLCLVLLAGLIDDDVTSVLGAEATSKEAPLERPPRGFGGGSSRNSAISELSAHSAEEMLRSCNWRLKTVASRLSTNSDTLATALIRLQVRVPLKDGERQKIGEVTILQANKLLRCGTNKLDIYNKTGLTNHWLKRIILDEPLLAVQQRAAVIENQRQHHRDVAEAFFANNPLGSRMDFTLAFPASEAWLMLFDRGWYDEKYPRTFERRPRDNAPRKRAEAAEDKRLADLVRAAAKQDLEGSDRPVWQSYARLLKLALNKTQVRNLSTQYPLLATAIGECSERREQHADRCVRWAVNDCIMKNEEMTIDSIRLRCRLTRSFVVQRAAMIPSRAAASCVRRASR